MLSWRGSHLARKNRCMAPGDTKEMIKRADGAGHVREQKAMSAWAAFAWGAV